MSETSWYRPRTSSVIDGLATTRSIHRFEVTKVSRDQLNILLFAASRGPSGNNVQPFRFLVLEDGPGLFWHAGFSGRRSAVVGLRRVIAKDTGPSKRLVDAFRMGAAMDLFVDSFELIPVIILACLQRHREPQPLEGASIYPACQNLLLAAADIGLGGTIMLWHEMVEDELKQVLGVPEAVGIAATIPIGVPVGKHGPLRRKPLQDLVFVDEWGLHADWVCEPAGAPWTDEAAQPIRGETAQNR